jgi:curved DNA-binding protein CbpA
MMNFYEEFGVCQDASVEEIRQAYKTLARLLHPDGQTDEKLRAAAACQMKRLHEVLDVLVDPRKRRAYDEDLAADAFPNAAGRLRVVAIRPSTLVLDPDRVHDSWQRLLVYDGPRPHPGGIRAGRSLPEWNGTRAPAP